MEGNIILWALIGALIFALAIGGKILYDKYWK